MKGVPTDESGGYIVPWSVISMLAEDIKRLPFWPASTYVPQPLTLRQKVRGYIWVWRQRIGYAIAGYTPSEDQW